MRPRGWRNQQSGREQKILRVQWRVRLPGESGMVMLQVRGKIIEPVDWLTGLNWRHSLPKGKRQRKCRRGLLGGASWRRAVKRAKHIGEGVI